MKAVFIIVHALACVGLICVVMLQKGKGAGMGAAFGGSSQTIFGSGGATTFLHKVTIVIAAVFMLTSLSLSLFFGNGSKGGSVMEDVKTKVPAATQTQKAGQKKAPAQGEQGESK